jgi:sec-independent protein translocase protein TatA
MGFGGLGMWEILLIFLVVLLLFGAKRLPEIGSSLGKGIREFKGSLREIEHEIRTPERTPEGRRLDEGRQAPPAPSEAPDKTAAAAKTDENGEPRKLSSRP